ncbi:hypothetical protein JNW91_03795 [Micromonospora sp. STR1_7]|uniref:Lipoprotein n=1 Tax=Micromonospora parastrephiae TaxID=2806101 RepID=A0ABS1XPA8_9ACTN|nr:hypothetical protein [Micromonospora parastrephiae]MBM0231073.1 hypothetical protein [Micromonospora parastrephiae]
MRPRLVLSTVVRSAGEVIIVGAAHHNGGTTMMGRPVRTVLTLVALAGLAAGCDPSAAQDAGSAAPSAAAAPSATVDVAANSKQVCETTLAVVKKHFVAMADDAIAAIDKPVSAKEQGAKVRGHYTALAQDLREEAPTAADPRVRTALENLAAAVEKRLTGPKATEVEAPDLDPTLKALDSACGR